MSLLIFDAKPVTGLALQMRDDDFLMDKFHICLTVIKSFKCKETEHLWGGREARILPANVQERALGKLRMLNGANSPDDLKNPPGNRLKNLRGKRRGQKAYASMTSGAYALNGKTMKPTT